MKFLTLLKHNTTFHSHKSSNSTERITSLLQDQIEFLQEQLKSNDEIINFHTENLSRNADMLFSQNVATLQTPEN